jgi:hypothetical protein
VRGAKKHRRHRLEIPSYPVPQPSISLVDVRIVDIVTLIGIVAPTFLRRAWEAAVINIMTVAMGPSKTCSSQTPKEVATTQ